MRDAASKNPQSTAYHRKISQAVSQATQILHDAGVGDERLTANLLLCHLLNIDRTQLLIKSNEALEESDYQAFLKLIERRATGEPLQYITGHQEFYGLDFKVTPDVLIPRPETEFLVEQIIKLAKAHPSDESSSRITHHASLLNQEWLFADIGTGSGCIAVTLAYCLKNARVFAIDISEAALQIARENAAHHQVASRIEFLEGDLFAPLAGRNLENSLDLIASNPPYVPLKDLPTLQREVRDYEPHTALFADENGLRFYRRLLEESPRYLKPGGFLVCEIGCAQYEPINQLLKNFSNWQLVNVINDLQGIPRTLTIRKMV
ncbi:MAG: peptide chain release factor N(5)-glutamine methyltransferase [Acidobacteriota bacterium]